MNDEMEVLVNECETSWKSKGDILIPNVTLDDAPLKELIVKAHRTFASESFENLDALAVRIADACPSGVTEDNFKTAKPVAGACRKFFTNVENLRKGLKRPALDWGKAVDKAAEEMVERAEPTLRPIINAVKSIEDKRKNEKEAAEAAEQKRILDEAKAKLEAEQAAERKRIADEKEANRKEADQLAAEKKRMADEKAAADAKAKAVNDELAALRKMIAATEQGDRLQGKPAKLVPMDSHGYPVEQPKELPVEPFTPPIPPAEDEPLKYTADFRIVEVSTDQQKVREFGLAIASMLVGLKRPSVANNEAKQAIELAVFDMVETAKRLQEWSGT